MTPHDVAHASLPPSQVQSSPPKPYRSFNAMLQARFGVRVYKVSIDAGFNCPNRDGTKGFGGCTFCDDTGSAARSHPPKTAIQKQIIDNMAYRKHRFKAEKFIAYFQAYTNTYAPVEKLKSLYDAALEVSPDIIGLGISTRPDCVDPEKLALIASYKNRVPLVCVEYGLQTIHNKTLADLNRCETYEDFLQALTWTKALELEHCVHVILGLPQETWEMQMATADKLAELRVDAVKIHLLVAMKGTPIADAYLRGEWSQISYEDYVSLCCDFIERLHPECILHRVSGNGHPQFVVAPKWVSQQRSHVMQDIEAEFARRGTQQGSRCRFLDTPIALSN
jgi:radical SAM protein (TIGR01212 family)